MDHVYGTFICFFHSSMASHFIFIVCIRTFKQVCFLFRKTAVNGFGIWGALDIMEDLWFFVYLYFYWVLKQWTFPFCSLVTSIFPVKCSKQESAKPHLIHHGIQRADLTPEKTKGNTSSKWPTCWADFASVHMSNFSSPSFNVPYVMNLSHEPIRQLVPVWKDNSHQSNHQTIKAWETGDTLHGNSN